MNESKMFENINIEMAPRKTRERIVEPFVSKAEKRKYFFTIKNHFTDSFPNEQKELSYMHPEILENEERLRNIGPNDTVRVVYIDRQNRKIEEEWNFYEYLRRIGFCGNRYKKTSPFDNYQEQIDNVENIKDFLRKAHIKSIQNRNKTAVRLDEKFALDSNREQQLKSQEKEDPYFCAMIEKSGFMHHQDLSILHDYLDAVDVMLELDSGEDEPVYLGVQRTLGNEQTVRRKKEKINQNPIWFIPEYPERNPVLRIVLREDKKEYFEGSTAKIDKGKKIDQETADAKTMQVLLEAKASVDYHIANINSIKEEDVRARHLKYFYKYQRVLNKAITRMNQKTLFVLGGADSFGNNTGVENENKLNTKDEYKKGVLRCSEIFNQIDGFESYSNNQDNNDLLLYAEEVGGGINILENYYTDESEEYKKRREEVKNNPLVENQGKKIFKFLFNTRFVVDFFELPEEYLKNIFGDLYENRDKAIAVLKQYDFLTLANDEVFKFKGLLEKEKKEDGLDFVSKLQALLSKRKQEIESRYKINKFILIRSRNFGQKV